MIIFLLLWILRARCLNTKQDYYSTYCQHNTMVMVNKADIDLKSLTCFIVSSVQLNYVYQSLPRKPLEVWTHMSWYYTYWASKMTEQFKECYPAYFFLQVLL